MQAIHTQDKVQDFSGPELWLRFKVVGIITVNLSLCPCNPNLAPAGKYKSFLPDDW